MRKTFVAITAFAVVPLGAAGCVSKSEYTKTVQAAETRYNALDAENTRLKSELDNARLTQDLAEAQKAREEKVREVSSTYEQLVAKMKGEIDKGQVTISELKGKLTVNMVEAILFDSGKAEVKPEGLVVLGKVIEILKTVNDKSIRIEGHTDNKPIVGPLTQRYPTNWELSAARAGGGVRRPREGPRRSAAAARRTRCRDLGPRCGLRWRRRAVRRGAWPRRGRSRARRRGNASRARTPGQTDRIPGIASPAQSLRPCPER